MKDLLSVLYKIAEKFSPDAVEDLSNRIKSLNSSSAAQSLYHWAIRPGSKETIKKLISVWQKYPELDPKALSFSLLATKNSLEEVENNQTLELIWTGPRTDAVPVRRTDQTLIELIESAKRELIIVSFFAYKVENIVKALNRALDRGVDIVMVLELAQDEGGKLSFDVLKTMRKALTGAKFYYWPIENRKTNDVGNYGSLHVKCAIADAKKAFISSANLSDYALDLNMELGVSVNGGEIPKRMSKHFNGLIKMETIIRSQ